MIQNKIYLLLLVLLTIVIQSISYDGFTRKNVSPSDRKIYNNDGYTDKKKYDYAEENYPQQSTYRRHRYPPYGASTNDYRSRSRWPSPYDDLLESNDWSRYGFGLNGPLPNFPGPLLPAFDNNPFFGNGPTCYSLLDPQYPLFSDICGAVPQARYALPNSFGHLERWQVAQILTTILGPATPASTNPACARSLRLLLCPLLFPPCPTRFEAPPVLPCQPFCRIIKNQCASPSLDLLPCDLLPPTSDLCPINPTPYSSLLSSFGPALPFNGGPSPLPPSALSALLAQSALAALTAFDPQPTMLPQPAISPLSPQPPSNAQPALQPQTVPSPSETQPAFGPQQAVSPQSPLSSLLSQSALSSFDLGPYGFPSVPMPTGISPSPFSSFLSSPGMQPPSGFSSLLSSAAMPPSAMSRLSSPFNPLLNMDPFMADDNLPPILVDFPPLAYTNEYRQAPRYFPLTRSATEQV